MQNLEKIEYLIYRYVLRLDIEQEYMHIYETGETDQASLRNGKNYSTNNLSELTHDAVLCEANFKNLRRVVLNPNAFVLKHKSGQYKRFDNQHIVDLIHSEMGNDLKSFGNSSGTRILKILVYRNVMTEEVINSIKETLKNRIEAEIDGLKSMLDYNLSNVFLNEYFYRACAKLDSNYFDEPLLILNNTVLDKSSPYIKERFTIALSVYNSESNLINQIFARDYNQIHSQYFKSNNKKQKLKSLFQSKPIITTSMIVMFFSILIKLISNSNFFE
ncbi:hypothetical protein [Crocinitomix catalasitica]|uniref:hypothetical protein n=1 Tax=Crocinitomix catalasitica TaxID=184607 RepID=UPI0004826D2B|nr:hypothetical protein [Crocinitomix catalasitica]